MAPECRLEWNDGLISIAHLQKRHHRTFSEDERIQAQENVKKVEDSDAGEISELEDQLMLQRDAKDWKVRHRAYFDLQCIYLIGASEY